MEHAAQCNFQTMCNDVLDDIPSYPIELKKKVTTVLSKPPGRVLCIGVKDSFCMVQIG